MLQWFHNLEVRTFALCFTTALCALLTVDFAAQAEETKSQQPQQVETDRQKEEQEKHRLYLAERLAPELILADLEQFRKLLKTDCLVATLNDADFDAAITDLTKRSSRGMRRSEYIVELQKIIALGKDGHAGITSWLGALSSFQEDQGFPDFIIDICGDDYIAYREEPLPKGLVNPRLPYRFKPLREGFPYVSAIDGVPIEKWVEIISRFVPKGPELSVRWRCMQWIGYLPFWRHQMGLPQSKTIKVCLTSRDKSERIVIDFPVGKYPLGSPGLFRIPKPDWKIIEKKLGYLWIRDPAARSSQVILEAMPQFRGTKGLIIDLRGNPGGSGREILQLMAAHLLRPDHPRRVVGSEVQWAGRKRRDIDSSFSSDDNRLSEAGRKAILDYQTRFKPLWNPPPLRAVQWRHVLLARPEAEPGIYPFNVPKFPKEQFYHYSAPVVVLMDHRVFSAGEIFLAGIRNLDNVTLVGSPTTEAGGTSPNLFNLENSEIGVMLGSNHSFVQTNGDFIDGKGIQPDIVVAPDVDYYLGRRDRMLETAIEVLKKKIGRGNGDSS